MQEAQLPASSRHSKVTPDSGDENVKDAFVSVVVSGGFWSMSVSGAVVSAMVTVQVCVAGVASWFPAWSIARTSKVCEPPPRPTYCFGLAQVAQSPACVLSMRHWKVSAAAALKLSVPLNWKLTEVLEVGFDGWPPVICVFGAIVSATFHVWLAGVWSTLPAWSVARTSNVCEPAPRSVYVFGLVQDCHALASVLSRRHWKVSAATAEWLSLPVNSKTVEPGWTLTMVVFGAVPSVTFQV